jgi:cytidine deaminase
LQLHRKFSLRILTQKDFFLFVSDVESGFAGPCGSCRQTLAEFGLDLDVYLVNPKNESKLYTLRELLPIAFTPRDLEKRRASHDIVE